MAGNANSGRRASFAGKAETVMPGYWPWERSSVPEKWTRRRIRGHLERWLVRHGLVVSGLARDAVAALADAHHLALRAALAIDEDPDMPLVGKRDAYTVQTAAHEAIRRALQSLGLWPLRRPVADDGAAPAKASGFEQPA